MLEESGSMKFYPKDLDAPQPLPEGVEHGSARAAMRSNCTCDACCERRARIRARRNGVRRR